MLLVVVLGCAALVAAGEWCVLAAHGWEGARVPTAVGPRGGIGTLASNYSRLCCRVPAAQLLRENRRPVIGNGGHAETGSGQV
jgi:hypothetical protein